MRKEREGACLPPGVLQGPTGREVGAELASIIYQEAIGELAENQTSNGRIGR